MISAFLEALIQVLAALLLSPLYAGILDKLKGRISLKRSQSVFQPYRDILKLFRKETVVPFDSSAMFAYAPYFVISVYILISFVIPVVYPRPVFLTPTVDFLGGALLFSLAGFVKIVSAMDSKSNYAALGVSRVASFAFLGDATLITVFLAVALSTGTNNPYVELSFSRNPGNYIALDHLLAAASFFLLWMFETGRLPVESQSLSEMGLVDEGLTFEYSGKPLGLLRWAGYLKSYLLGSVLLNLFLIPWGGFLGVGGALADVGIMFLKWCALILVVLVTETSLAKLRLFKIQDHLAVAFVLSVFALLFSVI
jgi:formate hydrogenlyase subunit 4